MTDLQILAGVVPFASARELRDLFLDFAERLPSVHTRAEAIVLGTLLAQTLRHVHEALRACGSSAHVEPAPELMTCEAFKAAVRALDSYEPTRAQVPDGRLGRLFGLLDARFNVIGLTSSVIAAELGVSIWHLSRLLRQQTGKTFREHLRATRIRHASRLLRSSDESIKAIAISCGYRSISQFDRHFRAVHGLPPSQYRDACRAAA